MRTLATRFLLTLLCCLLPTFAAAATHQSIHVEWGYTPPSEPAVTRCQASARYHSRTPVGLTP